MKQYQEISSLITSEPVRNYPLFHAYKVANFDYDKLSFKKYLRLIAAEPPTHPLAKRFNKLIHYTSRLVGNPNIKETKKLMITLLKSFGKDHYHDLVHFLLGQSIKIFLKIKTYTPEEYIYEIIVTALEEGISNKTINEANSYFTRVLNEALMNKIFPPKKLYYNELIVLRAFLKKAKQLPNTYDPDDDLYNNDSNDTIYKKIKRLIFNSEWYSTIHFHIFMKMYKINPKYPLAIHFRNEVVRELDKILTPNVYQKYRKKLYNLMNYLITCEDPLRVYDILRENLPEFELNTDLFEIILPKIEVFPKETKEIIRKFLIYMYATSEKFVK